MNFYGAILDWLIPSCYFVGHCWCVWPSVLFRFWLVVGTVGARQVLLAVLTLSVGIPKIVQGNPGTYVIA